VKIMNFITKGETDFREPSIRIIPLSLTQDEIKFLLPYLQNFVETGTLDFRKIAPAGAILRKSKQLLINI